MVLANAIGTRLFIPITFDWKALTETSVIDNFSQERGLPFGIPWHVVAACRRQFQLERLVSASNIRVLDQPVTQQ